MYTLWVCLRLDQYQLVGQRHRRAGVGGASDRRSQDLYVRPALPGHHTRQQQVTPTANRINKHT